MASDQREPRPQFLVDVIDRPNLTVASRRPDRDAYEAWVLPAFADAVHHLFNDTCRFCGVAIDDAVSEGTGAYTHALADGLDGFVRATWDEQDKKEDVPSPDLSLRVPTGTGGGGEEDAINSPDLYMETRSWPGQRGTRQPTLVITYEALLEILQDETAVLAPDDAPGLCKAIARRARAATASDRQVVAEWIRKADADIAALWGDEEDDSPSPSRQMAAFFDVEIANKRTFNRADPCTLGEARGSLQQMPEDVLVKLIVNRLAQAGPVTIHESGEVITHYDCDELAEPHFSRKEFETELEALLEHYGEAYPLIDLIPEEEETNDA